MQRKRNLLYFICPFPGETWRWNVSLLTAFKTVFNGRKVVVVASGSGLESYDTVRAAFRDDSIAFINVQNDQELQETAHFIPNLSLLESADENESTFYAHAKGVTKNGACLQSVLRWTSSMLLLNLGSAELVDVGMSRYSTMGCYRMKIRHADASWHYSGTFFWLKHSALFKKDWKSIRQDRYGVEGYPGRHIPFEDSFNLTPERRFECYLNAPSEGEYTRWYRDLLANHLGIGSC